MLCTNPFMIGVQPCPCGQCAPCRIKRKKLWSHRIMLESFKHGDTAFVTLTYDDEKFKKNYPKADPKSLHPKHAQDWLKRLRLAIEPRRIRYYLAGEYGDQTWRPHYHAVLFGVSALETTIIRNSWNLGHITASPLTIERAAYVAGYVTKKMTKNADVRLNGRHPEFQRMSLRPGIGAYAMRDVARAITSYPQFPFEHNDVPSALSMGGKTITIGRYLTRKLRENLGRSPDAPQEKVRALALEMRAVLEDYVETSGTQTRSPKKLILDMNSQKVNNLLTSSNIFRGNKTI